MRHHISIVALACACCALAVASRAADITFGSPLPATIDVADFNIGGTIDRAYSFGASSTINVAGITFVPFDQKLHGDTSGLDGTDAYVAGDGFGGTPYGQLLATGAFHDIDASTIEFHGLTPGTKYNIEVVASGLRAKTDCCSAGAGYTNFMSLSGDSSPGTGLVQWDANDATSRHIFGTFIADNTGVQDLNFNKFSTSSLPNTINIAEIHAVVLSNVSVPEPTTLLLFAAGITGLALGKRHR